ncbi:MAG: hypothetical protein ACYC91_07495 [Solirubrobacteraceae bacterium]
MKPQLDGWLAKAAIRITHARESTAPPDRLWEAARSVRLCDTALLGRLIRWRIPGTGPLLTFDELFRNPPFLVLEQDQTTLVSGLVGRIWTLRRDYPSLAHPDDFRDWSASGTAKVVFANWLEPMAGGVTKIAAEARVQAVGVQGRLGVAAVSPIISAFQNLIGSEGIAAAVRAAEAQI